MIIVIIYIGHVVSSERIRCAINSLRHATAFVALISEEVEYNWLLDNVMTAAHT